MRNGECSRRAPSVRHTHGPGCSLLPTPTVHGNWNRKGASIKSGDGLATAIGGNPNPTFVEWLMAFPLGWTALAPLETRRFQEWLVQHGDF